MISSNPAADKTLVFMIAAGSCAGVHVLSLWSENTLESADGGVVVE